MTTRIRDRHGIGPAAATLAAALCLAGAMAPAQAPSAPISAEAVRTVARALGFVRPAPSGDTWAAIVFAAGSAASRADADRIAALFGDGLRSRGALLRARPVSAAALPATDGYAALIVAAGAPVDAAMAAARARHVVCVTNEIADVAAGRCVLGVRSEPPVELAVSRAGLQACGIGLAAAFRMMVREL